MRSALQIQASNRNGPVAPQGNHVSSQNAIRYRLSVRTVGLCTENTAVFEFIQHLAPAERAQARVERTQARALAEFRRLRKIPPPGPLPIQITRAGVSTTGRDSADFREPAPDENEPKPEPWPSSAAIRKIRPSKSPAPNVSTTGRDPDFREPAPDENEPKPTLETLDAAPSENEPKPELWPSSVASTKSVRPALYPSKSPAPNVSTTGRDPTDFREPAPDENEPKPAPWPNSVAIRKIRPPGALPVQITRPDVSTTGRDPGDFREPRPR